MDDKHPEAITIRIDGKDRRLKLGPAAFRLAKLKHDTTLTLAEMSRPSFDMFATLTWIALLPSEPDLTELDVIAWLGEDDCDEIVVMNAVSTALNRMVEGMSAAFGGDAKPPPSKKKP